MEHPIAKVDQNKLLNKPTIKKLLLYKVILNAHQFYYVNSINQNDFTKKCQILDMITIKIYNVILSQPN